MSSFAGRAAGVAAPSASQPDSGVLAALRVATRAAHRQVDQSMPLSRQPITVADYVAHLEIIRAWLGPIESWLRRFSDGPQDQDVLPRLARLKWLEQDLNELRAVRASAEGPSAEPADCGIAGSGIHGPKAVLTGDDGPAFRWGVCYVIEGSSLGGLILGRRIAELTAGHRPRFLATDHATVGGRWQRFRHALEQQVHEPAAVSGACAGAVAAFADLLRLIPLRDRLPDCGATS